MADNHPSKTDAPVVIVLVAAHPPSASVLGGWETAVQGGTVQVVRDREELRALVDGLDPDQRLVVAEAETTPGPALLERLLAVEGTADVIDARVLPVDLALGPETDVDAEVAAATGGQVGPRVSGGCVLTTAGVASAVADVLGGPRNAQTGPALLAALEAAGRSVAVQVLATVVRHAGVLDPEGAASPAATLPHGEPPSATHPALLEATAVHQMLRSAGIHGEWEDDTPAGRPFLTVLTRTQGQRRQCLEDVLACLAAQDDDDFEWVIACHRADHEQLRSVREVVALAPPRLAHRIRVVEVERPGRSAPLNDGFEVARGRYVSVLDDDDTVAASWVSTFHRLEDEYAGRVLRAVAVRQSVVPHAVEGGTVALSVGNPRMDWPVEFDLLSHLAHNETPLMSAAFPRGAFHTLDIRFDETLDILEDWDFLVRTAGVVGVGSAPSATCVYRWWLSVETSRALHDEQDWDAARRRVLDGFATSYVLLPGDGARRLNEDLSAAQRRIGELAASQHEVILQLDRTANEHQKTVDNWRESEARVAELKEKLATVRSRFNKRLELIEAIEERLRNPGAERPASSIYEMAPKELEALLASFDAGDVDTPAGSRTRFGRRSR